MNSDHDAPRPNDADATRGDHRHRGQARDRDRGHITNRVGRNDRDHLGDFDGHDAAFPAILSSARHPLAPLNLPVVLLIRAYQVTLSPFIGRSCRFRPTCSAYGLAAFRHHHALRATWLTASRVVRCNPLCKGGYEPVPSVRRSRDEGQSGD